MPRGSGLVLVTSRMCAATFANLMATCWRERVEAADVRALFPCTDALLARYPSGVGTMNLVEQGTIATEDAREVGGRQIRDLGPQLLCTSNILLGAGFWIAAARATTSLINLLSRRPLPTRMTDSIDDAASWQAPRLGQPDGRSVGAAELAAFASDLLARFRARGSG